MTSLFQIATALEKGIKLTPTSSIIPKPAVKATSLPSVLTTTNVNQNAVFGAINYQPMSAEAGLSLSLIGGGGGGAKGGGGLNVSQVFSPVSNVSTQVSNVFTTTNQTTTNISEQISKTISNIVSSPLAGIGTTAPQTFTPSVTATPTVTPSQIATQTATPTITTDQTAGQPTGGMDWWQYLLIGGVAIVGIYMITKAFKGWKKNG
jgi:hypothetical protein